MPSDNKEIETQIDTIIMDGVVLGNDNGQPYFVSTDTATDKIQALIADQCRLARIDELQLARSVDSQLSSADIVEHLENRKIELKKEATND